MSARIKRNVVAIMAFLLAVVVMFGLGSVFGNKEAIAAGISEGEQAKADAVDIEQQISAVLSENTKGALTIAAPAAYLMDFDSGTELYAKNADTKRPIASMVKIMTLVLCLEEVEKGNINITDKVRISELAASMGGSQAFLDAGSEYTVDELIKTITIASANDSCVAMAELICGSVEGFVERMNARASAMGATNTLFSNCTGLPSSDQYSTARDVALMTRELVRHELYYKYSKIWMDKLTHNDGRETELANTNKLIRHYNGCDGGKTGFTNDAMFCLAATAKRGDMRLVSVIMGGADSKARFGDSSKLLNYGFASFENKQVVFKGVALENKATVLKAKTATIEIAPEKDFFIFGQKGSLKGNIEVKEEIYPLSAPIKAGSEVGKLTIIKGGESMGEVKLVALSDAEKMGYNDYLNKLFRVFANME